MSSRYEDDASSSRRSRQSSPPPSSGNYASGALPVPEPPGPPEQVRLEYDPQSAFFNPGGAAAHALRQLPPTAGSTSSQHSRGRPRSVPPPSRALTRRSPSAASSSRFSLSPSPSPPRSRNRPRDRDRDRARDRDGERGQLAVSSRTRNPITDNFTPSSSGLGVGVLGAIVGGLAAREIAARHQQYSQGKSGSDSGGNHHHHQDKAGPSPNLLPTLIGAAAGGLGANFLEKRLEDRARDKEDAWERKWGRREGGARPRRRGDRDDDRDDGRAGAGRTGRGRGAAADYYDVADGYDHVYDRRIRRRSAPRG